MHGSIPNGHPNHRSDCSDCGNHARATSLIPRRRDERHKGVQKLFSDLRLVSRSSSALDADGKPATKDGLPMPEHQPFVNNYPTASAAKVAAAATTFAASNQGHVGAAAANGRSLTDELFSHMPCRPLDQVRRLRTVVHKCEADAA